MNEDPTDMLWPHFRPLWNGLRSVSPGSLLTGGYGLFLKQHWLLSRIKHITQEDDGLILTEDGRSLLREDSIPTLIDLRQWLDLEPRVTKDFDFIAELDLIASFDQQGKLDEILKANGFAVTTNARWQFSKSLPDGNSVLVDFHAPMPPEERHDLRTGSRRIKPRESLAIGIHGRENPEAAGCHLYPFLFSFADTEIAVPNPVTWTVMKMVAMRDRRRESQNIQLTQEGRQKELLQAEKHAQDVCRVLAMTTRQENDQLETIKAALAATDSFRQTKQIYTDYFRDEHAWGSRTVEAHWRNEDLTVIRQTLGRWFS